mgnify:FL=1
MNEEQTIVEGSVEHIIYRNASTGYAVFELRTEDEELTLVGSFPVLSPGERIRATGRFVDHPTYGRQFSVDRYEKELPTTLDAIRAYLAGGAVRGVGPKTADALIALFGERTLEIIESSPEQLERVRGITRKKALAISENFREQFGIRRVMLFLQQYGIHGAAALSVWRAWGGAAEEVIRRNPYALCECVDGIRFSDADRLADQLGFDRESPFRISSAVKYILLCNAYQAGHTFLPHADLVSMTARLTDIDPDRIEDRLSEMEEDGQLVERPVGNKQAVYLDRYYEAESACAHRLIELNRQVRVFTEYNERLLSRIEQELHLSFHAQQIRAIAAAAASGVMVLTGGPGTGKTTALNGIIALYKHLGLRFALAAPTGRAAKRISEVTGEEAKTIHRLLEMQIGEAGRLTCGRHENNPLEVDAVVLDESSMIDIDLLASFLRAVPHGCRLVFVGDADQLPAVGPGNVLGDLIASNVVETVALDHVFRQAQDSLIIRNAHGILRGEPLILAGEKRDVFFLPSTGPGSAALITDLATRRLPKTYGFDPLTDIQVIALSKVGGCGTGELNGALRAALNPPAPDKKERGGPAGIFREGDKVMQIRNNYDITYTLPSGEPGAGIYNGDIGVILQIDPAAECMKIRFDDRTATYPFSCLDQLSFAYAMTVHKSQGSEFPCVVLSAVDSPRNLLYRNLLYTAVTRARELLVIVGDPRRIDAMIQNRTKTRRFSGLKTLLAQADREASL